MLTALALSLVAPSPLTDWEFVKGGILAGIGGIVLLESAESEAKFLIVHDNKKEGQARIATVTVTRGEKPRYSELQWEGSPLPVDLEALTAVPGKDRFVALTSGGEGFVLQLDATAAKVQSSFKLPAVPKANYEGGTLQVLGGQMWYVWGHRGSLPEPGKLYWSRFDPDTLKPVGEIQSQDVAVPWPTAETGRGISDLRIDTSGTLYLTAASDFGDDGPFQSVLYIGGVFAVESGKLVFRAGVPVRLMWTDQRKIEAIELVPGRSGGIIFGTDDENLGSSIWHNFWPR